MNLLTFICVLIACSLTYFVPAIIPFLLAKSVVRQTTSGLYFLFFGPYAFYAFLEMLQERQGFHLPHGFLLCGITPAIVLLAIRFKPSLTSYTGYALFLSLIACVLVWIKFPEGHINKLF